MCIFKAWPGQLGCKHYTEGVLVGGACATAPQTGPAMRQDLNQVFAILGFWFSLVLKRVQRTQARFELEGRRN